MKIFPIILGLAASAAALAQVAPHPPAALLDGKALFQEKCAMCHGPAKFRPPDVDALLKANYPHDRANDYTNGDLRGFYWAEVSKAENSQ